MYYNIKDGVYIVEGLSKASIFDCNNDKHYWVDKEVSSALLQLANRVRVDEDTISDAL